MPSVLSEIHGTWFLSYCALALQNDRLRKDDLRSNIFCFEIHSLTFLDPKELKIQFLRLEWFLCISWFFFSRKNILRFCCAEGWCAEGLLALLSFVVVPIKMTPGKPKRVFWERQALRALPRLPLEKETLASGVSVYPKLFPTSSCPGIG